VKQLVISRGPLETRVGLVEDGRAVELYVERPGRTTLVGNIYNGRVENVLAGMDAAFVDLGLDRNGFLYVDEVIGPEARSQQPQKITQLVKGGKELLVQVVRDPMGGKGPRLTTQIGLAGRYVVYLPLSEASGVSRRLEGPERERLRGICRELELTGGGMIVRTAAEGVEASVIQRELRFLQRIWAGIQRRLPTCAAPCLVYAESDLALRAVRDLCGPDVSRVVVDDAKVFARIANYLRAVAPELMDMLSLDEARPPLFERFGLEEELNKTLERRVELPSGGYLVIDHTEAMTVIDVNTGRYVGRRFLEDTTLKTNIEACREIVRQLRLRDIGGIIVIDFIDMNSRSNREAVLASLQAELYLDRTKTYVVEISPLGLVEMTRQNASRGLWDVLTGPCPCCHGDGRVLSEDSAVIQVERELRALARSSRSAGLRVELHPRIAERLTSGRNPLLRRIEAETGLRFVVQVSSESAAPEHLVVIPD
jgi:ribonuclease G